MTVYSNEIVTEKFLTHPYWSQFGEIHPIAHKLANLAFIIILIFGSIGNIMIILFHLRLILFTFKFKTNKLSECYF